MFVERSPLLWLALACYCLFITYVSLMPGQEEGDLTDLKQYKIPHLDKLLHIAAYWLYALLALLATAKVSQKRWLISSLLLLLILHGVALEYLQITLTLNREASLPDIIANTAGVLLGYFTMLVYHISQAKGSH